MKGQRIPEEPILWGWEDIQQQTRVISGRLRPNHRAWGEGPGRRDASHPFYELTALSPPSPSAMWALDLGGNPMPGNHRTEAINCSWLRKSNYFYVFQWGCFQLRWKHIQSRYLAQQLFLSLSKVVVVLFSFTCNKQDRVKPLRSWREMLLNTVSYEWSTLALIPRGYSWLWRTAWPRKTYRVLL